MNTVTLKEGTQICYRDLGSGQPVAFSRGWPLSRDAFEDQRLFLARHRAPLLVFVGVRMRETPLNH